MEIWNNLHNNKRKEIIIKSIIFKSIIDIFKEEKDIDITSYLISVTLNWKIIKIKTNKPIINTELLMINDKIKEKITNKLRNIWIVFYDFEIKYI